jgi:hypothetical protein
MPTNSESIIYFFSTKRPLYEDFSSLLQSQNSGHTARFIDTNENFPADVEAFRKCDMVLCDMNETILFKSETTGLIERVPAIVPMIGLETADTLSATFAEYPSYLRLAGIASLKKGWGAAWEKIVEMRKAWKSPYMHSRIEDVSPSDVLQMIGVSQWTAIVRIEGTQMNASDTGGRGGGTIKGCISFCKGLPDCAWSNNHSGMEAIWELLSLRHGVLDVVRRIWSGCIRNIHSTIEEILIAHALGVDESYPETGSDRVTPAAPLPSPVIRWPEHGPKRTLDGFWNRNRAAIARMLATADSGPFPLRLMKWRELERLVVSEIQTLFLIVYGDGPFVQGYMEYFSNDIGSDRLSSEAIPVIRLGKIGHAGLYIIGLRTLDTGMRILNRFPFIIEHGGGEKPGCLDMLLKNHARAAIIIADDADACIEETARRVGTRELQYCSLSVSISAAKIPVAAVLRQCAEILSCMSATESSQ